MPDIPDISGSVLVIGGGISGIQASLDLAESGFYVYLLEKKSAIGGKMVQLDKTFPTNDCAMCIISPKLADVARNINIEIVTDAELQEVSGVPGNFSVKILKKPRYVDIGKCTGCGECAKVCPVEIKDEFNLYLSKRKAIYKLYPQATPSSYVIEKRERPPCQSVCPAGVNVQGYIALTRQKKYPEAIKLIKEKMPFLSICGRICYHPCEDKCNRNEIDEPVAINAIKRFLGEWEVKNGIREEVKTDETGKSIAIIGSGPCGLSCAYYLRKLGHKVVIFERENLAGGMLRYGLPEYRLPKNILNAEIEKLIEIGVEIKFNSNIEDVFKLKETGYDAIFIATGASLSKKLNVEGIDKCGVFYGIEFLKKINLKENIEIGKDVVVIGGGNVAIDVARCCIRLGCRVSLVCLEEEDEMPAHRWEINFAKEEGVKIYNSFGPKRILGDIYVSGVEFVKCVSVFDKHGVFNPVFYDKETFVLECNSVIVAIGQEPEVNLLKDKIYLKKDKTIETDQENFQTNIEYIFVGGDALTGPSSFTSAVSQGRDAAFAIDRYFKGIKDFCKKTPQKEDLEKTKDKDFSYAVFEKRKRAKQLHLEISDRIKNFSEVEIGLDENSVLQETERCLNCGICSECKECEKVCEAGAILHSDKEKVLNINVGSIIVTTGYSLFDVREKMEYGYGRYPNVLTSLEFERILSSSGPTQGALLRPSDNTKPRNIAFISCIGSREKDNCFCSSFCCMYATKEAIIAKEHEKDVKSKIFYIDRRYTGRDFEKYYARAKEQYGIEYQKSIISKIYQNPENNSLVVRYINESGSILEEEFDLVVLSTSCRASDDISYLAEKLKIEKNEFGFIKTNSFSPSLTSCDGIYVAGACSEPKDIPESVVSSSAASACAQSIIHTARWKNTKIKKYPKERKIDPDDVRVGVFVCNCGKNIGGIIDVKKVVEDLSKKENVVWCDEFLYTCSQDSLEKIKNVIKEYNLTRVIVASCSPRTHEILFQDTLREAGLNPYLFEMANIREHCSWVHQNEKEKATEKAKELIDMSISKSRLLKPIKRISLPVNKEVLIIGGGIAGMVSGLFLLSQGFKVHIVEKEKCLGGYLRKIKFDEEQNNTSEFLDKMIRNVEFSPNVAIYKNAQIKEVSGFVGNFKAKISSNSVDFEINAGVIIVAVGCEEYIPEEYLYGKDKRVITQLELEEKLSLTRERFIPPESVVMIQCVGSRNLQHPYCSKVCCNQAIKNAIHLKKISSATSVFILHKDIRSYGFSEKYYLSARENGVVFIRYPDDRMPEVVGDKVKVFDTMLRKEIAIPAELVVLSTGVVGRKENQELSKVLKIPLTSDNFFLEAHIKLRPLDTSCEGIFLAGSSSSPRTMKEAITSAYGAASRALTILTKESILAPALIAKVKEKLCRGCGVCISVCNYNAREIDKDKNIAKVIEFLCQGCGACVAICPSGATYQYSFEKRQILDMIETVK